MKEGFSQKRTVPTQTEQLAALARVEAHDARYSAFRDLVALNVQERAESQGLLAADTGWVIETLFKGTPEAENVTPALIDSAIEKVKSQKKEIGLT